MKYQEFVELLKNRAHDELGYDFDTIEFLEEGYSSDDPMQRKWIEDSNRHYVGISEDGCLLTDFLVLKNFDAKTNTTNIHRIATRLMYQDFEEDGEKDFESIFQNIRITNKNVNDNPNVSDAIGKRRAGVYEGLKEQLILRPLNYRLHYNDLTNCIYRKIGDIALVLYQFMGDANASIMSSKIKMQDIEMWGMKDKKEEIMRDALENTMRLFPPCVYNSKLQEEVNFLTAEFTKEDITHNNTNMILLSTTKVTNGAIALFYPGVIEKMMKIMGGSFNAVFMNINDVMIFSRNDLRASLCADKASHSGPMGEMLSGKRYLCNEKGVMPA